MGILTSEYDKAREAEMEFCRALGGDPQGPEDLPFRNASEADEMPAEVYVQHDEKIIQKIARSVGGSLSVGLISEVGTGKTALRELIFREFGGRDDFIVSYLDNATDTTPRELYATVLRSVINAGYEVDSSEYDQLRGGIPWKTDDVKRALESVVADAREDDRTVVLIADQIEYFPDHLFAPLQTAGDKGVNLVVMGTPAGKEKLENDWEALDSRLRYLDRGIKPFDPEHIEEYIARTLCYLRNVEYDVEEYKYATLGERQNLFTVGAIEAIHEHSGGNPRVVRMECVNIFEVAAIRWAESDESAEDFTITEELARAVLDDAERNPE